MKGSGEMIYDKLIAQSRNPIFYTRMGVPDDLSGRYNMIVIHLLILFAATKDLEEGDAQTLRQQVFERFIGEIEDMVRDFGIDGTQAPGEVRNIVNLCSKQIMVYDNAIASGDKRALAGEILAVFQQTHEDSQVNTDALAGYVLNAVASVQALPPATILSGHVEFPA
jgi:cytochrome b pre-mRNA-processing protein 3